MMELRRQFPTVRDAVEESDAVEQWWGDRDVSLPSMAEDTHEHAMRKLDDAYTEYGDILPIERDRVQLVTGTFNDTALARASPVDCGTFIARNGEWAVEDQPAQYVIMVRMDHDKHAIEATMGETIRHELAHCANWELDGITYEREDIHQEWLNKLDTR